ncbi:MAG: hypothetical protein HQK75_16980 [Candidatus Magnetomorum sp.]|nr:hypothetical protein [Candidatus Magnetomorum sp.]
MTQIFQHVQHYLMYFKERFPIAGALLYSASLFYLSYFSANLFHFHSPVNVLQSVCGCFVIFLVLLHLRLLDEHKDYEKDRRAYPERMLSKGTITLKDLRKLLYGVLFIEAGLSLALGINVFMIWLMVMLWSYLMYVEFFIPEFLNQRMGLYLISHQLIVPIIFMYGMIQRIQFPQKSIEEIGCLIMLFLASICSTITFEIARKTWSQEKEHECADSYTKSWGINKCIIITQLSALLACMSFIGVFYVYQLPCIFILIGIILYLLFLSSELLFKYHPSTKNSKYVEITGILYMLGMFVTASLGFYRL